MRDRTRATVRTLVIIGLLNVAVAVAKVFYASWSGSLAVGADAIHAGLDATWNLVGVVALILAQRPPDRGHPYGHNKIESLAAAAIGVVIALGGARLGWAAFEALVDGRATPKVTIPGILLLGATLLINAVVATYEARKAAELNSTLLEADAAHTASDVLITLSVIGSQIAAKYELTWADPVAAIAVLLIVLHVAWRILSSNLDALIDGAAVDPEAVRAIACAVGGVVDCHRIRSRGTGDRAQLDLHITVDEMLRVVDAHRISHAVEDALRLKLGDVDATIHVEPAGDPAEPI